MNSTGDSADVRVPVICGPTAAGKSWLAMHLADEVGAAIVSADSRQVYRGFDIGTAKPSRDEQARIPYYGIDVVDPPARFSAAEWAEQARAWMDEARARGLVPLVVGGTGFYLRALFDPLFEAPPMDSGRRAALDALLQPLAVPELRRWCEALDPARAHLGRTQLLRAVETALLTGERISTLHATRGKAPSLSARYLLVDPGRGLAEAIASRVDAMFAAGWLDEVRALAASVPAGAPAWSATGYDALREVVAGRRSMDEAREAILVATRQYAKRQRTWFRHQLPVRDVLRVDPRAPGATERVMAWWRGEI